MKDYVRKSEKGGNAAYLKVGIWYEADTGQIHMTAPGSDWFHTTVNDKPNSKRGHHSLFGMLARALTEAGVPHPEVKGAAVDETKAEVAKLMERAVTPPEFRR